MVALTLGDVAGIGPEVVARTVCDPHVRAWCRPLAVGSAAVLQRALSLIGEPVQVVAVAGPEEIREQSDMVCCWDPHTAGVEQVPPGRVDARAGYAAYDALQLATKAALAGRIAAVATAPLNKDALNRAGHCYPGHTEILAELCGASAYAMMLYIPPSVSPAPAAPAPPVPPHGLGIAHVTLHTSLRSVPELLSSASVVEKIRLVADFLQQVGCLRPRVAVCALNPHAGEAGLFGDEESRIISPAIRSARAAGLDADGPFPADTLLRRAWAGEFDGVVAMYHDQGHIAVKLMAFDRAVNVTLGLPIVRTSPSHGTAYDIAWRGIARYDGMREAVRIACMLVGNPARQRQP